MGAERAARRRFLLALGGAMAAPAWASAAPAPVSAGPADPTLVDELVTGGRILFDQGVLDGFGHISARHDKRPDRFLLSRNLAPALVTPADLMEYDLDGTPVDLQGRRIFLERFIHGAIYRARPDVTAVVHSHSLAVVPFSVSEIPLRPVYHMAGFLGPGAPVFDVRDRFGPDTDMLVRSVPMAEALAASLGDGAVVLLRGHGAVAVGPSIRAAVFYAVFTELNARAQADALRLGRVNYLNEQEAAGAAAALAAQVDRPWELWRRELAAR